jgi:mycothiol synthase
MSTPSPQLVMRRPHLRRLPESYLLTGYTIRDFRAGDEQGWAQLLAAAFERELSRFDFRQMLARDPAFHPHRVKFVIAPDGSLAASACAWVSTRFGMDNSTLHWVGTAPAHKGKRLGYEVSLAALKQAFSEGRAAAYLLTDDERIAAIKTYLRLGFVPVLTDPSHACRWRTALEGIGDEHHLALLEGLVEIFR